MTKSEWILFFAGAQTFHTLSHMALYFTNALPMKIFSIVLTKQLNLWIILINLVLTVALFWWAKKTQETEKTSWL